MNAESRMTNFESVSPGPALLPRPALVYGAPSRARSVLKRTCQLLTISCLACASYFLVSHYLVQTVQVVGVSMVPTLSDSDHYLLNRWIFRVRSPKHSEVVVLRDPSDNGFSVKRVIATAGESIYLKGGNVYVNGRRLDEPYLRPGTPTFTDSKYRDQLILCGKNQYFLLGDNRLNSVDSRVYGPVPRQNILGLIVR
jgi:signal peptidase I